MDSCCWGVTNPSWVIWIKEFDSERIETLDEHTNVRDDALHSIYKMCFY